jgi:hypothetical protein
MPIGDGGKDATGRRPRVVSFEHAEAFFVEMVVGSQVESGVAVTREVEPPKTILPVDHRTSSTGVGVAERLEYARRVRERKSAPRHGQRRASAHAVEELSLGGAKVLERAVESTSRAGRLHHFVVLDQQRGVGESLVDASDANERVHGGEAPTVLVARQARHEYEGRPVAQRGGRLDLTVRSLRVWMQGDEEREDLSAMLARAAPASLHLRTGRLGREIKGCAARKGDAMYAGQYLVTAKILGH